MAHTTDSPCLVADAPAADTAPATPAQDAAQTVLPAAARRLAAAGAVTAATAWLSACGGGGGGGGGTGTAGSAGASPFTGTTETVSADQAAQFLLRADFAATETAVGAVQAQGLDAWLDAQFAMPVESPAWDWLLAEGYNIDKYRYDSAPCDYFVWKDLISAQDTLRKRVALALSEILVVSVAGVDLPFPAFCMARYWDVLNEHAFGNYRDLLQALTTNIAMGEYLNMRGSVKEDPATGRRPDENYAREIMQLFTIGLYELNQDGSVVMANGKPRETYTNDTIGQLARVFTGWNGDTSAGALPAYVKDGTTPLPASLLAYTRLPMTANAARHSTTASTLFGQTVDNSNPVAALQAALNILFNHPNVGPFIGRQLIQRLVTSNPSPAYVSRVAAAFNGSGSGTRGDMKAVIRAVLTDPEAKTPLDQKPATWGKLREPVLRIVQFARTYGLTSASGHWKLQGLWRMGQSPLRSPSVFNFYRPGYVPPGTALAANGLVAPEFQITDETTVTSYINFMDSATSSGIRHWDGSTNPIELPAPAYSHEMTLADNPLALVQYLNRLLGASAISDATLQKMATGLADIKGWSTGQIDVNGKKISYRLARVWAAVLMVVTCPEYLVQR